MHGTNNRYVSADEETKIFLRLTCGGKNNQKYHYSVVCWLDDNLFCFQFVTPTSSTSYYDCVTLRFIHSNHLTEKYLLYIEMETSQSSRPFTEICEATLCFTSSVTYHRYTSYDSLRLAVLSVTDKESGDAPVWVESKKITISWFVVTGVLVRNTAENAPSQPSSTQQRWKWQHLNKAVIVLKSTKPRFHLLWHLFPAAMRQGSGYSDLKKGQWV